MPQESSSKTHKLDSPVFSTHLEDSLSPVSEYQRFSREPDQAPSRKHCCFNTNFSIAANEFKLSEKWAATAQSKKFAVRAKRASLTDFDRFKVMINRKNRSFKLRQLAKKISGGAK